MWLDDKNESPEQLLDFLNQIAGRELRLGDGSSDLLDLFYWENKEAVDVRFYICKEYLCILVHKCEII